MVLPHVIGREGTPDKSSLEWRIYQRGNWNNWKRKVVWEWNFHNRVNIPGKVVKLWLTLAQDWWGFYPMKLLSDFHWTLQSHHIFSGGGASVNANVRVRDFILLASYYTVQEKWMCEHSRGSSWSRDLRSLVNTSLPVSVLLPDAPAFAWITRRIWSCCEHVCAENLLLCCARVIDKLQVKSGANSLDFTQRSCLKKAWEKAIKNVTHKQIQLCS